jgi:hypothetical protein
VGCEFCYLGQRSGSSSSSPSGGRLELPLLEKALGRLNYDEVAVAVSEPIGDSRAILERIRAVIAEGGPRRLSVTTTMQIARTPGLLVGVDRVNLSVDPRKGKISLPAIERLARKLTGEVVLIVSLTTPEFAEQLLSGLLAQLLDLPSVDKVALNALKPPPAWCGREFWMRALARLAPLLERALDKKLFLDCWVAARLLHLGGCPARADLTPEGAGLAFRSCVYQREADFVSADAGELADRLRSFTAPAVCPFPIP